MAIRLIANGRYFIHNQSLPALSLHNQSLPALSRTISLAATLNTPVSCDRLVQCYQILRVPHQSDLEVVRESYLKLAKQYHPDSGSNTADSHQFTLLEHAYRDIVKHQQEQMKQTASTDDEKTEFDIRHTAPQHRQYLEYEGVGFGTPSTRQRQYQQVRVARATENVTDYRMTRHIAHNENSLVLKDKQKAKMVKISSAIDRLVEDLILESMSKGEFDNLPGKGKPLVNTTYNPMIDSTTHNLNRLLIENGFAPPWITLQKEISNKLKGSRGKLFAARVGAGPEPISSQSKHLWDKHLAEFRDDLQTINKNIERFNLMVPSFHQQIMPYSTTREIQKVLEDYNDKSEHGEIESKPPHHHTDQSYTNTTRGQKVKLTDILKDIKALFYSS